MKWADPAVLGAKLTELEAQVTSPQWERERERNLAEAARLRAKLGRVIAAFGDDPDPEVAEALKAQVGSIKAQSGHHEQVAEGLADRARESAEARALVEDLRCTIAGRIAAGPTEEDRAALAELIGLEVRAFRRADKRVEGDYRAFATKIKDRGGYVIGQPWMVGRKEQTTGRSPAGPGRSAASR